MKNCTEIDAIIKSAKSVHMIGIGGSGMCPLAEILHKKGYAISGSDNNESDQLKRLRTLGIDIKMGNLAQNIGECDIVVYSAAISQDNPELVEARKRGLPTIERSKLLGALTRSFSNCIGVCGTHGKTTVSAMLTHILILNNVDPTAVIGGRLPLTNTNGVCGESDVMVCESCEFVDTFLELSPDTAVLLNIDNDHLDYFKTMENMCASFTKFVSMASTVIVNGDDALAMDAVKGVGGKVITFGFDKSFDYYADNLKKGAKGFAFDLINKGEVVCSVEVNIPGKHNVYNALAAAVAALINGVEPKGIASAIASFGGAGRRFEVLGSVNGAVLVDDYAHHPTEIEATLRAAREHCNGRLIAVFQPFTFSRTALLLDEFAKALSLADRVVLTPIMGSREKNVTGITSQHLAALLPDCVCVEDFEGVKQEIKNYAKPCDTVITMGGGDIYKAAYLMRDEKI